MSRLQRGLTSNGNQNSTGGFSRMGSVSQSGMDRANSAKSFEELKRLIHSKLVDKLALRQSFADTVPPAQ